MYVKENVETLFYFLKNLNSIPSNYMKRRKKCKILKSAYMFNVLPNTQIIVIYDDNVLN